MLAMDSSALRLSGLHALSLTTIAGKPAPTGDRAHAENEVTRETVGASLLAMDASAPRLAGLHALPLTIAGKPAPTGDRVRVESEVSSRPVKAPKKGLLTGRSFIIPARDSIPQCLPLTPRVGTSRQ